MHDYSEMEALLLIALSLSPTRVKDVATATGIKSSRLYKWKTKVGHLSQQKQEILMAYFIENEPNILILSLIVMIITTKLVVDSASQLVLEV